MDTATSKMIASEVAFDPPLSSVAVTVSIALPAAAPVSVSSVPSAETSTVATAGASDSAVTSCS